MKGLNIIFATLLCLTVKGQNYLPSYDIVENNIIYIFHLDQLDSLFAEPHSLIQDFDSLLLVQIIEKKSIDKKLENGWSLKFIDENLIQIRKSLDDFNDGINLLEKYMIPSEYWLAPRSILTHSLIANTPIYNIDPQGSHKFYLRGHENANQVILAGSFNDWDEQEIKMTPGNDGWYVHLDLQPGIFEYKFIVDGQWYHDKSNPLKIKNEHHTYNSILLVGEKVAFSYSPNKNVRKVYLVGSFNNWDRKSLQLKKVGEKWETEIQLPPGKHFYKFIVDGNWITDPENELSEPDDNGIFNSVLLVN